MATVYIAEFRALQMDFVNGHPVAAPKAPPIAEQTVAIGGSSVQSNAFNSATRFIRVHTDAICSIAIDGSPTATTSKMRMSANTTEFFGVPEGGKIAVITNT